MKTVDIITFVLIAIGGLNWGFVGLFGVNIVELIFGVGTVLPAIIYGLVGLSALWQLFSYNWAGGTHYTTREERTRMEPRHA